MIGVYPFVLNGFFFVELRRIVLLAPEEAVSLASRRLAIDCWTIDYVREKVCRSGFRGGFFWCLILRCSSLSGDGSIRPDLRLRRRIYFRWTVGFCLRRPYLLLRVSSPLTAEFPLASSLLPVDESDHHLDACTCIAGRPYA
ncbi:hypothetical protein F2Q70_00019299 [Brassica cretica]|uniref:Uncharacterized protein n=1 Tax=Brassica cretica TaxID=69181 RepID=A0A8S9GWJ6_BRACR|nr:hypothetical protein F2Q70_00019299 [Brassica cretica]KAF3607226.1 hypothetical protein DY000_02044306 [Brassica cretica]